MRRAIFAQFLRKFLRNSLTRIPTCYSCMRASQSKQATGSLATGNTTIKRNQPQAGPVTDQGQELVVRGGPSAKI